MKKILLVWFAVLFIGSTCFAEEAATTVTSGKTASKSPPEMQTFIGKVDSLTICTDPYCGNRSEIVVVDGKGNKMVFAIRTGIGVTSWTSEKLLSLSEVKKGDSVTIEYIITRDGTKKAITIFAEK